MVSVCSKCVMTSDVEDFVEYGEAGCNYCIEFKGLLKRVEGATRDVRTGNLSTLISRIKADGRGKDFDCIVGVSGGVDSSWVLVKAAEERLRPLAVHMDNGWNSELAQNNINNLIKSLGVELYTHVIDWSEYKALMQSFFDAGVLDVELLYDNAMLAVNYQQARKHGIKYILSGDNAATEGMRMPPGWNWLKFDKKNIRSLAHRNHVNIKTFPLMGTLDYFYNQFVKGIRWTHFLDLYDFNKFDALNSLEGDFGYRRYPYKHYESVFTRFYQGYILPRKFGVDKRRLHLSSLIISGQMSRDDALSQLAGIPYPSEDELNADIDYFLKKMGWSKQDLDEYINRSARQHEEFGSEKGLWDLAKRIHQTIYR